MAGNGGLDSDVFMWIVGAVASAYGVVLGWLSRAVFGLQRQLDRDTLETERRFALRTDVEKLRDHVDDRFDRIEEAAEETRKQIMEALRGG